MPTVKRHANGKIITKNGKVACECCGDPSLGCSVLAATSNDVEVSFSAAQSFYAGGSITATADVSVSATHVSSTPFAQGTTTTTHTGSGGATLSWNWQKGQGCSFSHFGTFERSFGFTFQETRVVVNNVLGTTTTTQGTYPATCVHDFASLSLLLFRDSVSLRHFIRFSAGFAADTTVFGLIQSRAPGISQVSFLGKSLGGGGSISLQPSFIPPDTTASVSGNVSCFVTITFSPSAP